jgi:myb proto-oncogene protein
LLRVPSNFTL